MIRVHVLLLVHRKLVVTTHQPGSRLVISNLLTFWTAYHWAHHCADAAFHAMLWTFVVMTCR